jgi:hypothetical protein
VLAEALEGVLERERVQNRGQHPHVVAGRAVHAGGGAVDAAVDVAGADDDRHLDPAFAEHPDLLRDPLHLAGVGAELQISHQRLAGELEEDPPESGLRGRHRGAYSPTRK